MQQKRPIQYSKVHLYILELTGSSKSLASSSHFVYVMYAHKRWLYIFALSCGWQQHVKKKKEPQKGPTEAVDRRLYAEM